MRRAMPTLFRRMLCGTGVSGGPSIRIPLHQPLGVPPAGTDSEAVRSKWGSNGMDMVQVADVFEVPGPVATCDGGGGPLGHPIEYIQIDRADAQFPAVCKYCGNKFMAAKH